MEPLNASVVERFYYDNKIVKYFIYATVFWGIVAFSLGLFAASLLFAPTWIESIVALFTGQQKNLSFISFGRIRPLHTNAAIFAFVGNTIFSGVYYSLQRLLKARMWSDKLSWFNFWGWQIIIVLAVITLPAGYTSSKEYAELEWPIDVLIVLVWLSFGANMFGTIFKRRVKYLYVAIWFYIATFFAISMLHIFNNLELPYSWMQSYSVYAGAQDALMQWWYGHNAVAFFLTTPVLGLMYYFVPKASNRPVFSYKLSIIHFWSLIFVYIWAGSHHLLNTALPNWTQVLGTIFSIMLIGPSWGGMLNGLLTLRGAWDKVREEAPLKFFVVGVTCYGMATFEGPMLATKTLNSIGHFTDWVIAHVHLGTLGWNGFMAFGMLYWLVPVLWRTRLYSIKLTNVHFWFGTLGIIFYVIPMYWSGWTQAELWKEFNPDGTLVNKNFLDTVIQIIPFYILRFIGGTLYIIGSLVMVYNLAKTMRTGKIVPNEAAEAPALSSVVYGAARQKGETWHNWIERKPIQLTIFSAIVLSIGSLIEIVPLLVVKSNIPTIESVKPYTPLELTGRDIYIREGCNNCHSQMIRPFRDEIARYGEYSKAGEFVYDHPFLWGSKRTGPDLAREGIKNPSPSWHFNHMRDPRYTSPGSIMPGYPWLIDKRYDTKHIEKKMKVLVKLGVPYSQDDIENAYQSMDKQAQIIVDKMYDESKDIERALQKKKQEEGDRFVPVKEREIIALIAYLQKLGTDIQVSDKN